MKLDGRVALVTGAASGIGRAAAVALAAEGARVMVTDIDDAGGRETAAACGGKARYLHHDVTSEPEWISVVAATVEAFGGLDILVNNAGIAIGIMTTEMPLEAWNRQIAVNLTGVFLGCKHGIPAMRETGRATGHSGSIINISSVAGLQGAAGLAGYNATKGGVRLFTKGVAKEVAGDRIRCNSVHPGIIDTPIWSKIDGGSLDALKETFEATPGANTLSADLIAATGAPIGVAGRPEDIAAGIVFLASDASSYMTGSELVIDGGWTA